MLNFIGRKRHPIIIRQGITIIRVSVSTVLAQGRPSNQLETPEDTHKVIANKIIENMNLIFCMFILFGIFVKVQRV